MKNHQIAQQIKALLGREMAGLQSAIYSSDQAAALYELDVAVQKLRKLMRVAAAS